MILTGKCKEDFLKWNYDDDFGYIDHEPTSLVVHFDNLNENLQNNIIIEFFDSVKVSGFKSLWSSCFGNYDVFKDNWNKHIEQAIKKANEVYNKSKNYERCK